MPHSLIKDDQNENCLLKMPDYKENHVPLILTEFSHGQVKINNPNELNFQCFKKDEVEQKEACKVTRSFIATNGRLTYEGSSNMSSLRYFVGVRNKKSGEMKFYDSMIYHMKPKLKMKLKDFQPISKTYIEGLNALNDSFGTKSRKRALNLKQKYTIDASLVKDISVPTSVLKSTSCNDSSSYIDYLPPLNRIASSVNDVFNVLHFISSEEDTSLNVEVQELLTLSLDKFTKKRFSFCKYVSMRFENVTAVKGKYLLYFNYLIIFQRLKYTDMRKKDPSPDIPDPYKKKMLEKFTVISRTNSGNTMRSCSNQLKDKLVAYLLVLGLFIDDYKVNLDELAENMSNVKVPKLTAIAEALGCYISKVKVAEHYMKYAQLKIPLNVPVPKFGRSIYK